MNYVALMLGISPMNAPSAKLASVFEDLRFSDVCPVLSSGNVLFSSDSKDQGSLEGIIEKAITDRLGISNPAIVLSVDEIHSIVVLSPFGAKNHSKETYLTVTFLKNPPVVDPLSISAVKQSFRVIHYDEGTLTVYAVNDTTVTKTPELMTSLEKALGKSITTRTWNTILKINKKLEAYA